MVRRTIFGALSVTILFHCIFSFAHPAAAQDPIRVQSNEVLVPTVVFDKELYAQLNKVKPHRRVSYGNLEAKNAKLWDDIAVKNLMAKDFHLYEDGQEQTIQGVKLIPPEFRVVADNLGKHPEIVGSGGGLWGYPDLPKADLSVWYAWPQYVLTYIPPKSAPGSCHRIQVKVEHVNLTVWARSEYCNIEHQASNPLEGTEFGKQLEGAAASANRDGLDLKLRAAVFADNPDGARVYVSTSFPGRSLTHKVISGTLYATIGSLVVVYRKDGSEAARYSDFACCDYGDKEEPKGNVEPPSESKTEGSVLLPDRYATQFSLPAGEYDVRVVLSDGLHFGIQDAPLTVGSYDANKLGMSELALCRRVRKLSPELTEGARVADSYIPLVSNGVEFTLAADAQYWPDETLFVYFEIYHPLGAVVPSPKVQANMRIANVNSGAVVDTFEPVDLAKYTRAGNPVIDVGRGVMLKRLSPGAYRLEVRASDAAGNSTAWRSTPFTVLDVGPLEMGKPTADH
jgi:hypothetical protein